MRQSRTWPINTIQSDIVKAKLLHDQTPFRLYMGCERILFSLLIRAKVIFLKLRISCSIHISIHVPTSANITCIFSGLIWTVLISQI